MGPHPVARLNEVFAEVKIWRRVEKLPTVTAGTERDCERVAGAAKGQVAPRWVLSNFHPALVVSHDAAIKTPENRPLKRPWTRNGFAQGKAGKVKNETLVPLY